MITVKVRRSKNVSHQLKEAFGQFVSQAKNSKPSLKQSRGGPVYSGTTILAMKFMLRVRQGKGDSAKVFEVPAVILASDGRITSFYIESDEGKKIRLIDERTAIGVSGVCFIIDKIAKYLQLSVRDYDDNVDPVDQRLTLRSKADMLGHTAEQFVESGWPMGFVLAGYEAHENRCRIFNVGSDGFVIDKGNSSGNGSGYEPVSGLLESYAGKTYSIRRVINVMKKVFKSAFKKDSHSGGRCRAVVISPLGCREVDLNA